MRPGHASGKLEPALKRPHLVPERPQPVPVGHKPAPERPEIAFEMAELDPWRPEPAFDGPWARRGDGRTDVCTDSPCVLHDFVPQAQKERKEERQRKKERKKERKDERMKRRKKRKIGNQRKRK